MPSLNGWNNTNHNRLGAAAPTLKPKGNQMTRVIIELEFDDDDVTEADVINYVNELIENDCLAFEIVETS